MPTSGFPRFAARPKVGDAATPARSDVPYIRLPEAGHGNTWVGFEGCGVGAGAASGVAACDGGDPLDDGVALHASALATDSCPVPAALQAFHLTARPWAPLALPRARFLDRAQAVVQSIVQYQDASGAIIDPTSIRSGSTRRRSSRRRSRRWSTPGASR
jgi:hypothetical protein